MSTLEKEKAKPGEERRRTGARARAEARLQQAFEDEDITLDTLEDRLRAVQRASTLAEIEAQIADLPDEAPVDGEAGALAPASITAVAARRRAAMVPASERPQRGWTLAILGGTVRKGKWRVPAKLRAVAALGGVELDLRDAILGPVTEITAVAVMGGVEIKVPAEARVECDGAGILGGFEHRTGDGVPGGPLIRIRGAAIMGGVDVRIARADDDDR
ncbi:MAG: DUF1707 domain-containing protein [Myxococcales bacterium]|nr:DUF1707 domain-containing protein [Myxococcales bacterium]